MTELLKHDEIAKALQLKGDWVSIQELSETYEINTMNAHSVAKRIETSKSYNVEIKKEGSLKYIKVLPDGVLSKEQQLSRLALFGVPMTKNTES